VYFLFVRSCVERELGSLTQLAQRRERTASLKAVAIGRREALRLVRNIAGGN
jgi:hypothetical protein